MSDFNLRIRIARLTRLVATAAVLLLISVAHAGAQAQPAGGAAMSGSIRAGQYRIQVGDVLQYRVWPTVEASGEFPVESSGVVYLPMAGVVTVGGKTLDEVRGELRTLYARAVQGATQPVITVTALFPFSVIGSVENGGLFEGRAGMTVFDAVSTAGGFRDGARPKHVDVTHADGTTTQIEGTSEAMATTLLRSQDRVTVPVTRRFLTTQGFVTAAQLLIGIVTLVKLL